MTKYLVVLDTNIFVSALLFPQSNPGKIIRLLQQNKLRVVYSLPLLTELKQVFSRSKRFAQYLISNAIINELLSFLKTQTYVNRLNEPNIKVRDLKDEIILATALQGHANYLVTGDKDLLVLSNNKSINPLKIVTPTEFIKLLKVI